MCSSFHVECKNIISKRAPKVVQMMFLGFNKIPIKCLNTKTILPWQLLNRISENVIGIFFRQRSKLNQNTWNQLDKYCHSCNGTIKGDFLLQFRTFYSFKLPETSLKDHLTGLKVVHLEEIYNR